MSTNTPKLDWVESLRCDGTIRIFPDPPADDDQLWLLLARAARALQAEDIELRNALSQNPHGRQVGQGLSYRVFEHNLVYPIFRDWCRDQRVMWEEPPDASYQDAAPRKPDEKRQSAKYIDLQLDLKHGGRLRFEAKWWIRSSGPRVTFEHDLERMSGSEPSGRNFCMAFWYGIPAEHQKDFQFKGEAPFDKEPVFAACFPSRVFTWWHEKEHRKTTDGYFAMVVWEA
jgi:hypothetical protein